MSKPPVAQGVRLKVTERPQQRVDGAQYRRDEIMTPVWRRICATFFFKRHNDNDHRAGTIDLNIEKHAQVRLRVHRIVMRSVGCLVKLLKNFEILFVLPSVLSLEIDTNHGNEKHLKFAETYF